jgi:hypothetical protein
MMVEAASILSLHTPVETLDYNLAMSMHACVVSLLKVVARRSALGMKILISTYGWTRHHRCTCGDSFLKFFLGVIYLLVGYALYHSNSDSLVWVLSRGMMPWHRFLLLPFYVVTLVGLIHEVIPHRS